jgi:hypothetical protein
VLGVEMRPFVVEAEMKPCEFGDLKKDLPIPTFGVAFGRTF